MDAIGAEPSISYNRCDDSMSALGGHKSYLWSSIKDSQHKNTSFPYYRTHPQNTYPTPLGDVFVSSSDTLHQGVVEGG